MSELVKTLLSSSGTRTPRTVSLINMGNGCRRNTWLVALLAGLFLFTLGLLVLRHNPYWRNEIGEPGIDHRVYAWSGIGRLFNAIGLLSMSLSPVLGLARAFKTKWLYWAAVVACLTVWWVGFGLQQTWNIHYGWDTRSGVTEFTFVPYRSEKQQTRLWQFVVRLQVEPELNMWLAGSSLRRTHGWLSVRVLRIVPIAIPTLDCDCHNCCVEQD